MSEPEMKLTEDKIKPVEDEVKYGLKIRAAEIEDVPLILEFVKGIARFENLSHLVMATEENLAEGYSEKGPMPRFPLLNWAGFLPGLLFFSTISLLL
jgi:hypothetical protein